MAFPLRPLRAALAALALLGVLLGALARPAAAAPEPYPDVDVVLVAEVHDGAGWLALHQEVLGTRPGSAKALRVGLPARTGGGRAIDIQQPRFTVALVAVGGKGVKITVSGKVKPAEALGLVTPFQQAALEVQAGLVHNELTLLYGLSGVVGRLLELYFDRP